MKKTIRDYEINGKTVIIRADLNVPIENGIITDDNRIRQSLETINYVVENNAKVVILSHLGRIKEEKDLEKYDMKPVAKQLSILLNKKVKFINKTRGDDVTNAVNNLKNQEILVLQNTRYEDLIGNKESSNDESLAKYWSSLGDIFINDAFGTSHRSHASNVGIASNLPSGIGFLVEKEIKYIKEIIDNPKRPFIVILGGAKVKDKIKVIEYLVNKADYILIGGAMAYTFLKAKGIQVGDSIVDEDNVEFCSEILDKYPNKIMLPVDSIVSSSIDDNTCKISYLIKPGEKGFDIGPKTIELFERYINLSNVIIWNGPLGAFENEKFANGTKQILQLLVNKTTIIAGGDTASAAINMGFKDKFTHISTGGGASLELMEGKELPGIGCIDEKTN